jgi:Family of unknown function (DUF6636)
MRPRSLLALLAFGAVLLVPAASALALVQFQSPSTNIGCIGDAKSVRCDIRTTSAKPPKRPKSCRFDWGSAFEVRRTGRGHGLCAGDTALATPGDGRRKLAYGRSIRLGKKLTCTSRITGMTCRSRAGHGFTLSKTAIRLF